MPWRGFEEEFQFGVRTKQCFDFNRSSRTGVRIGVWLFFGLSSLLEVVKLTSVDQKLPGKNVVPPNPTGQFDLMLVMGSCHSRTPLNKVKD